MPLSGAKVATDDDDDRQSSVSVRASSKHHQQQQQQQQRLKPSYAASSSAGDRVSCDSGISLDPADPVLLSNRLPSPALVQHRKPPLASGGAKGGGVDGAEPSHVRRMTQLFECLSHEELSRAEAYQSRPPPLAPKPIGLLPGRAAGLKRVTEEVSGSVPGSPEVPVGHGDEPMSALCAALPCRAFEMDGSDGPPTAPECGVSELAEEAQEMVSNESETMATVITSEAAGEPTGVEVAQDAKADAEMEQQVETLRTVANVGGGEEDRLMAATGRVGKKRLSSRRSRLLGASMGMNRRTLHEQHQHHQQDKIHEEESEPTESEPYEYGHYDYDDDEFDTSEDETITNEAAAEASDGEFGEQTDDGPEQQQQPISEAHNIHVPQVDSGMPHYEEHDEFSSSSFDSDSDGEFFAGRPDSSSSLKTARVTSILQELLENEANYVQTLGRGIQNYVSIMAGRDLPPGLRGQKYHIFGNIEKIHSLHQNQLLPALQRNRASIQGIAETFIWFLENDKFYCYIMFALNRPKSERICNRNLDFFQCRQAEVDDKLGLNSFLLQPIQRLPRYKLLLAEINKEILKQLEDTLLQSVRDEIGVLCKAEKRLERFIDIVNEAMSINDIHECYEGANCVQTELMNAFNVFNLVVDAPMVLILRPHTDHNPAKREPINLFSQGKFRKMFEVDIYDWDHRRRYAAKLFVFERSVIYAEKLKSDHLEYRGRYDESEIGLHNEKSNKMYLYARKRGLQEIEVICGDMNETQRLSVLVEGMMREFAVNERWRVNALDRPRIPSVMTLNRRSINSIHSASSTLSIARESFEPISQTTWSTDKPIPQLATMQKNFCRILAANRRYYFNELPMELAQKVSEFVRVYDRLLAVHIKRVYEDLAKPDTGIDEVCELFIGYLKDGVFDDYNSYIRLFKSAAEVLRNIHKASRSSITDSMVAPTMDEFTFLCVEHWNKLQHFFQALVVQISDQMNAGNMENQELFRKLAYAEVQVTSFRKLLFQNYRLFNLDVKITPAMLGLVVYSDRVRYENETISSHRVLLCDRAVVCVKFHFIRECGKQTEKYNDIVFIDRFGREQNIRVSKKSEVRLNVTLEGTKHPIDFGNTANRDKFYGQYCSAFARAS